MNTIVIPVSKERPEDDVFEMVDLCKKLYPDAVLRVGSALVVETDDATLIALFKKIAGSEIKATPAGRKTSSFTCPDCGTPVSKPGKYCRAHAQQRAANARKNGSALVTDIEPEYMIGNQ